ncbi:hypothetical protein AB1399_02950, partial [Hydrogenibacillus schlegelii]|uniref:hypothetical protein n=1 Tax=Hydrogenibacillus schlegelii TaxID=1484 RepID=UPI00349FD997
MTPETDPAVESALIVGRIAPTSVPFRAVFSLISRILYIYNGRKGKAAREGLYRRLIDASHREPDGAPLILLVPEQMTFAVERALVRR